MHKAKQPKGRSLADFFDKRQTRRSGFTVAARQKNAGSRSQMRRRKSKTQPLSEEEQNAKRTLLDLIRRDKEIYEGFRLINNLELQARQDLLTLLNITKKCDARYKSELKWPTFVVGHPSYFPCTTAAFRNLTR